MRSFIAQPEILICDPNLEAIEPLRRRLIEMRFSVRSEVDGQTVAQQLGRDPPDLLIVDWDFPGFASLDLFRKSRSFQSPTRVYIVILSALGGENEIIAGLENGADDYITKPYSVREASARVAAILRPHLAPRLPGTLTFGDLELDASSNRVSAGGQPLGMRSTEFRLLEFLMMHAGRTFNREQLLVSVWGRHSGVDVRTVDVNVQRIRRVLTEPGFENHIQTVRGFGYRFGAP